MRTHSRSDHDETPCRRRCPDRGVCPLRRAGEPRGALPALPPGDCAGPRASHCPRCAEDARLLWLESRSKWHCYSCRYQFSVTAGTLFHRSHLPVWKWLAAVHLMLEAPEGISAGELRRQLGGSYKTAWFAAHRIRAAMRGRGEELLRSLISAELGRVQPTTSRRSPFWEQTSGAELELDLARAQVVAELGRRLAGPYHHLSGKHLIAYLDERRWRFAQRGNPHAFADTIRALLRGEGLTYVQLVAER